MQRLLSCGAVTLLVGVAMFAMPAFTEARGGGGGGHGGGGGAHFSGGYGGRTGYGGFGRFQGAYHYPHGYLNYGYPNFGFDGYYPGYYGAYSDSGVDPTYYGESGAVPSYGYVPPVPPPAQVAVPDSTAHVTVRAPVDAEIWFGGKKTTSTGSVREYQSPPLTAGQHYDYQIRARWTEDGHPVSTTQTVDVTAGSHASVLFLSRPHAASH